MLFSCVLFCLLVGISLILLKERVQLQCAGLWQHFVCKSPAMPQDIMLLVFLKNLFPEEKNPSCAVCPSLSQWLHTFHSPALFLWADVPFWPQCWWEAFRMAINRWSPKILATSSLRLLEYLLPDRTCHWPFGWITVVSWAGKKLHTYKCAFWLSDTDCSTPEG